MGESFNLEQYEDDLSYFQWYILADKEVTIFQLQIAGIAPRARSYRINIIY